MKKKTSDNNQKVLDLFAGCYKIIYETPIDDNIIKEFKKILEDSYRINESKSGKYKYYLRNNEIDKIKREKTQLIIENLNIIVGNKQEEKKVKRANAKEIVIQIIGFLPSIIKASIELFKDYWTTRINNGLVEVYLIPPAQPYSIIN